MLNAHELNASSAPTHAQYGLLVILELIHRQLEALGLPSDALPLYRARSARDAASPIGDTRLVIRDTVSTLGVAHGPIGDTRLPIGDTRMVIGDAGARIGDTEIPIGDRPMVIGDIPTGGASARFDHPRLRYRF
jgi:hypothetical protein